MGRKLHWLSAALLLGALFFTLEQVGVETRSTIARCQAPTATLLLDAGHGGFDGGATGCSGVLEKDVNLAITQKLAAYASLCGYRVEMTRTADVSTAEPGLSSIRSRKKSDLYRRLAQIEENEEATVLSIHQNSFPDARIWGAQVFYSPNHPGSRRLAERLQQAFHRMQPENLRQPKPAEENLFLMTRAKQPAVLIECGFLTNPTECAKLEDAAEQQRLAHTILSAVMVGEDSDGDESEIPLHL